MSMNFILKQKISENDLFQLNHFLINHKNGNFFQSAYLFNFYKELKGYQPGILLAVDEMNRIHGVILWVIIQDSGIKGKFSRRCIVEGGPVVIDDDPVVTELLLNEFTNSVKSKTIYIEFRNLFETKHLEQLFKSRNYDFIPHLNILVPISNEPTSFKNLNNNRKRQITKSSNNGAIIVEAESIQEVEEFYIILKNLYDKKVKKPLPPLDFFTRFFLHPLCGKIFLIKYRNSVVGGIVCPVFNGVIYEWYIAGQDTMYKEINPSVLATWAPIKYASNNGLRCFDFFGAGRPDEDYGVREFKLKFGGETVSYGRYLRVNSPFIYCIGKLYMKMKSKER